ncbi:hypothetical protein KAH37_01885 [bacterium]|nr:hypothetical protein [bacterium]
MNRLFLLLMMAVAVITISCAETQRESFTDYGFYNDQEDMYTEYTQPEPTDADAVAVETWDIEYTFYGVINEASTPLADIATGDGTLFYLDADDKPASMGAQVFAVKKYIYTATETTIPLLQIFFLSSAEDGEIPSYVLQIEGSSITKDTVFYLNNNKVYRAMITKAEGKITNVCFNKAPKGTSKDGFIQMFTHSIRTGEVLSLNGKANMQLMDPEECHEIN